MTPDQATELLAMYELTGHSVSETARRMGLAKSTVSKHLRRANAVVDGEPEQFANVNKTKLVNWAVAWGNREVMTLAIIDEKAPEARFRDLSIFAGIAADKRYREEHPESVRGINISGENVQVNFDL